MLPQEILAPITVIVKLENIVMMWSMSQCFNNNVCAIYGNSIDGDCSKCSTSSNYDSGSGVIGPLGFEVNPNSVTGLDCIKYTITLTDGSPTFSQDCLHWKMVMPLSIPYQTTHLSMWPATI